MTALLTHQKPLLDELRKLDIEVVAKGVQAKLASLSLQPSLIDRIKEAQKDDVERIDLERIIEESQRTELWKDDQGVIRYDTRLWVPASEELRKEVLKEAYSSAYTVHPESTKMYKNLKRYLWWNNMKRDMADHVAKCLVCQQEKIEH